MEAKVKLLNLSREYQEIGFKLNEILRKNNLTLLEYKKLPHEDFIQWKKLKQKANEINEEMTKLLNRQ